MGKEQIIKDLKEYADLLNRSFAMSKMLLFGSYANGKPDEYSDIDVAVILKNNHLDYFTTNALLRKLRRGLNPRIEPIYFDENEPDPSRFIEDILKNGILIWEA